MLQAIDIFNVVVVLLLFAFVAFGAIKCHLLEHAGRVSKMDWAATALVLVALAQIMKDVQIMLVPAAVLFGLAANAICARMGGEKYRLVLPVILFSLSPFVWYREIESQSALLIFVLTGVIFCLSDCIYDTFTKKKAVFILLLVIIIAAEIIVGKVTGAMKGTEHIFDILMLVLSAILSVAMGVLYKYFSRLRMGFTIIFTAIVLAAFALVQIVSFFAIAA